MKLKTFLLMMLTLMGTVCYGASYSKCLLHHKGAVTLYNASELPEAINNAVAGDTIYLSQGSFSGFTLSKDVTIIGAGADYTIVSGDVTISIPNKPNLKRTLVQCLKINNNLNLSSAMTGVKISQCYIGKTVSMTDNEDVVIERCYIGGELYQTVKSCTVLNSIISKLAASSSSSVNNIVYENCNIQDVSEGSYLSGIFNNCIISSSYSNYNNRTIENALFNYSLISSSYSFATSSTQNNCYFASRSNIDAFDPSQLESNGYFGSDGKIVGMYGGFMPYTLTPATPQVTQSSITVDNESKVLNVNIKVSNK